MKQTRLMMGMPITIEIADASAREESIDDAFLFLEYVDDTFSTYKPDSEISRINQKRLELSQASAPMQTIFAMAEETRQDTDGYFDILHKGHYDPSGLVKGWAILNAAAMLRERGYRNFYVEAGGDIEAAGVNAQGEKWRVGIRNPFNMREIVKVLEISDCGVATSGTYVRGQHIYNPKGDAPLQTSVLSLTVIGPNIYEADRFATAAFAMDERGVSFIGTLEGFEAYQIDQAGVATFTDGFERYVLQS
ncbi:MAG: FAD:protein FMN transferase [Chloroflexi bacterium]|nr:FAD:protein FMN transferase [Chloroflexota bacterium]